MPSEAVILNCLQKANMQTKQQQKQVWDQWRNTHTWRDRKWYMSSWIQLCSLKSHGYRSHCSYLLVCESHKQSFQRREKGAHFLGLHTMSTRQILSCSLLVRLHQMSRSHLKSFSSCIQDITHTHLLFGGNAWCNLSSSVSSASSLPALRRCVLQIPSLNKIISALLKWQGHKLPSFHSRPCEIWHKQNFCLLPTAPETEISLTCF